MTTKTSEIVTIRAKAFTGDCIKDHKVMVDGDGTVRVWDRVAGYYTTCHSLTESAQRKARKLAGVE